MPRIEADGCPVGQQILPAIVESQEAISGAYPELVQSSPRPYFLFLLRSTQIYEVKKVK
jgi:hypothetical protein